MSKRTKFLLGIGVIATLLIGWQVAAYAVHEEGVFELEGNAVTDHATAGLPDDWDRICKSATADLPLAQRLCTSPDILAESADDVSFVPEPNPQSTFFTGGGSKDPQDIPDWKWKNDTGGLPDKANLTNSYAASYTVGTGATAQDLLYFGADRFDGSGDAAIAFWFLQNEVGLDPVPPASGAATGDFSAGTPPDGTHEEGDVLVISNFSNGGNVSTITVYEWNTACGKAGDLVDINDPPTQTTSDDNTCGAANLLILETSTNADCNSDTISADDIACATVNSENETAPWPFDNKDQGTANNEFFLPGEFFEGGINLTELGLGGQCFATALAETRTSTSPTSTLKDFTIGPFGDCSATMKTQASVSGTNVTPGTTVTDTATLTGSGTTPPIAPTGTITFFLCGPGQLNEVDAAGCSVKENDPDTQVGSAVALADGQNTTDGISTATSSPAVTVTTPGTYCFRAEYDPGNDPNYDAATHTNNSTTAPDNECFTVKDTSSITTTQSWLPQDKATVTTGSGGATPAGTVVFSLYESADCTGTATTFTDNSVATGGVFETNNTTYRTTSSIISWSATYTPSDPNAITGSTTTQCERSDLTINNSASVFPPPSN